MQSTEFPTVDGVAEGTGPLTSPGCWEQSQRPIALAETAATTMASPEAIFINSKIQPVAR
jgi:hypothetical protein